MQDMQTETSKEALKNLNETYFPLVVLLLEINVL
jgi:hypothetical protein